MTTKKPAKKVQPAKTVKAAPKKAAPRHPLMVNGQSWNREAVMSIVCSRIASSSMSIATILAVGYEGNTLPDYWTFKKWLAEDAELATQYARAKEDQADFLGEEMIQLHEKAWVPILDGNGQPIMVNGKPLRTVDKASAAAVRLEAENKKWLMGKLRPKKYGDVTKVEHSGSIGLSQVLDDLDGRDTGLPKAD